jgi:hypothetical protein
MWSIGWITPVSLFTRCTATRSFAPTESARAIAAAISSTRITPFSSRPMVVTGSPVASAAFSTAACSPAETTTPSNPSAFAPPTIACVIASVAEPVNTTCSRVAPASLATLLRDSSTSARSARPWACTDDGFPVISKALSTASRASGSSGAEALWSRYVARAFIRMVIGASAAPSRVQTS